MSDINEVIGKNIAIFRGDMSQAELADLMKKKGKDKGVRWSQTTVWEVEKGKRALKFSEALVLADILGIPLSRFYDTSRGLALFHRGGDLWTKRNESVRRMLSELKDFQRVQYELSSLGRTIQREASEDPSVRDIEEYGEKFMKLGMASLADVAEEVAETDRRKHELDLSRLPDTVTMARRELGDLEERSDGLD